jgi:molecular chaperone DnaK (HSP70)
MTIALCFYAEGTEVRPYDSVIGIDLGSKFSRVAIYKRDSPIYKSGHAEIIPNTHGQPAIPSYNDHGNSFETRKIVMTEMKELAEAHLGKEVHHAVVTVPAGYNEIQRQELKDAAQIAGLNVLRVLSEPIAASLAFNLHNFICGGSMNAVVFDLGASTLDVTLLSIDSDVFEVLSTMSNSHLGGQDFTQQLLEHVVSEIKETTGVDMSTKEGADTDQWWKLQADVERAKIELSTATSTTLTTAVNSTQAAGAGEIKTHTLKITRDLFEELTMPNLTTAVGLVQAVLDDAGVTKEEVLKVVLIGGSTHIPKIRELLTAEFGGDEQKFMSVEAVRPEEAVAMGAAVQGWDIAQGEDEAAEDEDEDEDEEDEDLPPQVCRGCLCAPSADFEEFQAVLDGMKARQIGHHAPWRGNHKPMSWGSLDWHAGAEEGGEEAGEEAGEGILLGEEL